MIQEHFTHINRQSCAIFKMIIFRLSHRIYILKIICTVNSPYLKNPSQFRWTGVSLELPFCPNHCVGCLRLKINTIWPRLQRNRAQSSLLCPMKQGLLRTSCSGAHHAHESFIVAAAKLLPCTATFFSAAFAARVSNPGAAWQATFLYNRIVESIDSRQWLSVSSSFWMCTCPCQFCLEIKSSRALCP